MAEPSAKPVVFLAFSNARSDSTAYLRHLADEYRALREALGEAEAGGLCELVDDAAATPASIFGTFLDPRYRHRVAVFHFGGHANGYQLLMQEGADRQEVAHAGGLAAFLGQQRGLQLVFLNGCSTRRQAEQLRRAGVPAVVTTDRAIDDRAASTLARHFYERLGAGDSLGQAFAHAVTMTRTRLGDDPAALVRSGAREFDITPEPDDPHAWPWALHPEGGDALEWNLRLAAGPLYGLPPLPERDLPAKPYRHLNRFTEEHAELFFGRGQDIRQLYDLVTGADGATSPILLLFGASGVGKSSLLEAGLVPRLRPSHAVRVARRDQNLGLLGSLRACLDVQGDTPLPDAWRAIEATEDQPLLVILDQAEEAYTRPRKGEPDEVPALMSALVALFAGKHERPRGKLLLGFRKEWLAELEHHLTGNALPYQGVFLRPLDRAGVLEAITGPFLAPRLRRRYGLTVEAGLADTMADALLADPGSPVASTLQVLLAKLWDEATAEADGKPPTFDRALYDRLRRRGILLEDFLAQQLEALATSQPSAVASGLALDVLAFHTTPLGTAEQRTLGELTVAYGVDRGLPPLLRDLQDLYLLVALGGGEPDRPDTRLTHDTLAPPVRRRFDESDLPGQRARRILEGRAVDWEEGRDGATLDEADLRVVEAGQAGMRAWTEDEERLLDASRRAREARREAELAARQEKEAQRQRELEAAQALAREAEARERAEADRAREAEAREQDQARSARRLRAFSWVLASVAVVAMLAAGLALRERDRANREARTALAQQLAAQGQLLLRSEQPETGGLLILQSLRYRPTFLGQQAWFELRDYFPRRVREVALPEFVTSNAGPALAFGQSGQGDLLLAVVSLGTSDGLNLAKLEIWNLTTGAKIDCPGVAAGCHDLPGAVRTAAFDVDGTLLALGGENQDHIDVLSLPTGKEERLDGPSRGVQAVAFGEGKELFAGGFDGSVVTWDLESLGRREVCCKQPGDIVALEPSPDGKWLAMTSWQPQVEAVVWSLWDLRTDEQVERSLWETTALAFSRDSSMLAHSQRIGASEVIVKRFASGDRREGEFETVSAFDVPLRVDSIVFDPDGEEIALTLEDQVQVWDIRTGRPVAVMRHDAEVVVIGYSKDGRFLATVDRGRTATVWELGVGTALRASSATDDAVPIDNANAVGLVEEMCPYLGRNLSHDEWLRFNPINPYQETCRGY